MRARTTHRAEWAKVTAHLAAMKGAPPPVPGPQERRSQNDVAFAIAEMSLAYAVEQEARVPRAPRRRGRSPRSTTSRGATPTTSPTPISRPAICSTRSAGRTTCSTTTSRRPSAHASACRSNATPISSTTRSRRRPGGGTPSPRTTTSFPTAGLGRHRAGADGRVEGRGAMGRPRARAPPSRRASC